MKSKRPVAASSPRRHVTTPALGAVRSLSNDGGRHAPFGPQTARSHPLLFALAGSQQGAVFPLHGTEISLGRSPKADVEITDDAVSLTHAKIARRLDGLYLVDEGSRNGTFLNQERVVEPCRLIDGDHLRIGNTILRFSMLDELEERALTNLFELTVRDPLTRAYNRRFLLAHLNSELAFAVRQKLSLALLLVDIDHFKRVNDTHGHGVGDVVLQLVASSIQRMLRPYDVLCRYGGEEFIVVARDTSQRNAEILAERIRRHIESTRFDLDAAPLSLTVSVGVTSTHRQGPAPEIDALLAAADAALYDAKHSGRNRVCARHPSTPPGGKHGAAHTLPPVAGDGPDEQQTLPPS